MSHQLSEARPFVEVVLATSVDGKIADRLRSPARFGSPADRHHLETQIAQADATLFGAGTLRAYGTTLPVTQAQLLAARQQRGQPAQPIQIVCSQTGNLSPSLRFFHQPVPRWLLTTAAGAQAWHDTPQFHRVLVAERDGQLNWTEALAQLSQSGVQRLVVMGGGTLVAALLAEDLVDELWVTVCPLVLGGREAPALVEGPGWAEALAPRLRLMDWRSQEDEVFLHYRVCRQQHNRQV